MDIRAPVAIDLGEHRLKGLEAPEKIWQILPESLKGREFPPLNTLDPKRTNLPRKLTSFVGRQREIAQLGEQLTSGESHLVTLLGPGGTGKTRLSLRLGAELLSEFPAGVWFADATEATSESGVCSAVAQSLGVPLTQADAVKQVGHALQGRCHGRGKLLMIFDNAEQVVDAAASAIAEWMQLAPEVRWLVTSRELLNIEGEVEYRLDPLPLPEPGEGMYKEIEVSRHTAKLEAYASVKLFLDRARSANPKFKVDEKGIEAICEICRMLDGIPLAIELAASRSKLLKPEKLLAKLQKDGNAAIKGSRRDVTARQATLDGAIEWSWNLLGEEEQQALCTFALFRGGFLLEHAEGVIDDADEYVASLLDKSLLRSYEVESIDETRYGMYRSIQDFALSRASDAINLDAARERWAETMVEYAEEWSQRILTHDAVEALDRVELELDNLLGVQDALEADHPALAAQAIHSCASTLGVRGPWSARIHRLQRALNALGDGHLHLRLKLACDLTYAQYDCGSKEGLESAAAICMELASQLPQSEDEDVKKLHLQAVGSRFMGHFRMSAFAEAAAEIDRALEAHGLDTPEARQEVYRNRSSLVLELTALVGNRGESYRCLGDNVKALEFFAEAEAANREYGNNMGTANNIGNRGNALSDQGKLDQALACYAESEAIKRELGDLGGFASALCRRGIIYHQLGEYDQALACYAESESISREIGFQSLLANVIGNRGLLLRERGEYDQALALFIEAEALNRELGNQGFAAIFVGNRGNLLRELGRFDEAWEALEEAESICRKISASHPLAYWTLGKAQVLLDQDKSHANALALAQESCQLRTKMGELKAKVFFDTLATLALIEKRLSEAGSSVEASEFGPAMTAEELLAAAKEHAQQAKALGEELKIERTYQAPFPKAGEVTESWRWVDVVLGEKEE